VKTILASSFAKLAIGAAAASVVGAVLLYWAGRPSGATFIDPANQDLVVRGKAIDANACAACHGAELQGQLDSRERLASGRLPAPPHDRTAPGYQSYMMA